MRFIRQDNEWYFDYVTDFSYMGRVYPELEKEMDFCWSGQYVFHYLAGDISLAAERNELWSLWEGNFMDYLSMGIYRVTVTVESCWPVMNRKKTGIFVILFMRSTSQHDDDTGCTGPFA